MRLAKPRWLAGGRCSPPDSIRATVSRAKSCDIVSRHNPMERGSITHRSCNIAGERVAIVEHGMPDGQAFLQLAYIRNDLVQQRLFCDLLETIKISVLILVGLRFPILAKSASIDAFQVCFRIFSKPVAPHRGALQP